MDRIKSAFTTIAEDVPLMSLLVKDHKPVKSGALPTTRPVIGISATMVARLLADVVKRLADCSRGSDEMKSREHLQVDVQDTTEVVRRVIEDILEKTLDQTPTEFSPTPTQRERFENREKEGDEGEVVRDVLNEVKVIAIKHNRGLPMIVVSVWMKEYSLMELQSCLQDWPTFMGAFLIPNMTPFHKHLEVE